MASFSLQAPPTSCPVPFHTSPKHLTEPRRGRISPLRNRFRTALQGPAAHGRGGGQFSQRRPPPAPRSHSCVPTPSPPLYVLRRSPPTAGLGKPLPRNAGPAAGCRPSSPERPRHGRDTLTTTSSKMLCSCVSMGTMGIAIVPPAGPGRAAPGPPLDGHGGAGRPSRRKFPPSGGHGVPAGRGGLRTVGGSVSQSVLWLGAGFKDLSCIRASKLLFILSDQRVGAGLAHSGQTGWSFTK